MVPKAGFEPAHPGGRQTLNLVRLPFRHFGTSRKIIVFYGTLVKGQECFLIGIEKFSTKVVDERIIPLEFAMNELVEQDLKTPEATFPRHRDVFQLAKVVSPDCCHSG